MRFGTQFSALRFSAALLLTLACGTAYAQNYAVTEVVTDYQGFWQSSSSALNGTKPDNSHNLVSFVHNSVRYSTGVNDKLLTDKGIGFTAGHYEGYYFESMSSTAGPNTKIALGERYDGVTNGASSPAPVNDMAKYLRDGAQGLDIGTGVANIPKGTLKYEARNILKEAIGDGIPDILVTQIADPSGSTDRYEFLDANGNVVGRSVSIKFNDISRVGEWVGDFYSANKDPMTLESGFKNSKRDLRLWAADFSSFGLTKENIGSVRSFVIHLNGNSDLAFVAYNANAFLNKSPYGDAVPLPVSLSSFYAAQVKEQVQLTWTTASEQNSSHFEVEESTDGKNFYKVGTVGAAGNSTLFVNYSFARKPAAAAVVYYRLKQVDLDDTFEYSKTVRVAMAEQKTSASVYPNPVAVGASQVVLQHGSVNGLVEVWNLAGVKKMAMQVAPDATETAISTQSLEKGVYLITYVSGQKRERLKLLVN